MGKSAGLRSPHACDVLGHGIRRAWKACININILSKPRIRGCWCCDAYSATPSATSQKSSSNANSAFRDSNPPKLTTCHPQPRQSRPCRLPAPQKPLMIQHHGCLFAHRPGERRSPATPSTSNTARRLSPTCYPSYRRREVSGLQPCQRSLIGAHFASHDAGGVPTGEELNAAQPHNRYGQQPPRQVTSSPTVFGGREGGPGGGKRLGRV